MPGRESRSYQSVGSLHLLLLEFIAKLNLFLLGGASRSPAVGLLGRGELRASGRDLFFLFFLAGCSYRPGGLLPSGSERRTRG